jgi:FG-GAP-like repeat
MNPRAFLAALALVLFAGTAIPVWTRAAAEGVTGLPADVTPMLTLAGIWQGVADEHVTPVNRGGISNFFSGNLRLHNGREGIVIGSWSFAGFANTDPTLVPVSIALFEQQGDGTLQLATSRYVPNPLTNGISSVVIADFNRDGVDDFVMPTWNGAPSIPADSVAFLSTRDRYDRVVIRDNILAHGSTVADIDGKPTVFTATYSDNPQRTSTVMQFDGINGFTLLAETGVGGASSSPTSRGGVNTR